MRQDSRLRARLVPVAAAMGVSLALGACSATPDWANPVEWYKGAEGWFEDDEEAARARERARRPEMQAPGADQPFPSLSTVPARPDSASMEERRMVAGSLVADRERARHTELGPGDNPRTGNSDPPGAPPPPRVASPPQPAESPLPPSPAPTADRNSGATSTNAAPAAGTDEGTPSGTSAAFRAALDQRKAVEAQGPDSSAPTARRNTMAVPAADPIEPSPTSEKVGTVYFDNNSSGISSKYSNVLRNIVKIQKEQGGTLRVVGHASSRTRNVSPLRHRIANLRISMDRARAVADRLIRYGAPADKVLVSAMADNRPAYHEVMPSGEARNRRAEIYLDR